MTTIALKKKIHQRIDATENENLLQWINNVLADAKHIEVLTPEVEAALNEAEEDEKNGRVMTQTQVKELVAAWRKK